MDRFSRLNDDLLIKILSFFPTKDAVATSVLSKRWLSLWKMVPRLTFEDIVLNNEVHPRVLPSHVVFGTLLLHKSPVLESFHLNKASLCSDSEIYLWVKIAVDRSLRHLKISFKYEQCFIRLPSSLFRSEALETLELGNVVLLEVPSSLSLQSLRKLRLRHVKYSDEESFIRLISSSPVLKELCVGSCIDDNVETFTINVPSLLSLTVEHRSLDYNIFVIHTHSLNRLTIEDQRGEVKVIGKIPELVEARLLSMVTKGNALESLTFAKCLSLTIQGLYPTCSVFFRLVRLEFIGYDKNWPNLLMQVLQHSPILQSLKLAVLDNAFWNAGLGGVRACFTPPRCVPECLLLHLKTFKWELYEGGEVDKEVAVYILNNARRLVTAAFFVMSYTMKEDQVFEELEIATRGSRACELSSLQ